MSAHPAADVIAAETRALNAAAERLWASLAPRWPGLDIEIASQVDSTNARLVERARRAPLDGPAVLLALQQSAGRGRLGRRWSGTAGASLMLSIALPWPPAAGAGAAAAAPAVPDGGLALAIGLAAAEALHPAVLLKWPNDLCLAPPGAPDRLAKLGGILIEVVGAGPRTDAGRTVVIGIGLNVRERAARAAQLEASEQVRDPGTTRAGHRDGSTQGAAASRAPLPAAALDTLRPGMTLADVFESIVPAVLEGAGRYAVEGVGPLRSRFAARDALLGRPVVLSSGSADGGPAGPGTGGTARGLDDQGRLLVHTAAGLLALTSGEVSVRPHEDAAAG